jgi:hypothetical protein
MIKSLTNLQSIEFRKVIRAKHIAIPAEHGAWIFLLSPLTIGLFLGGFSKGSLPLVFVMLAAFLIRQPVTIIVKVISGRRSKNDLYPALVWCAFYGLILIVSLLLLIIHKYVFILYLAVPAIPVFMWHLWLVSKRAERRQKLIEIAASGVLALAAPAAFWIGKQTYDSTGWLIWMLTWSQVAGTIYYAYLRLNQRQLKQLPDKRGLYKMAIETIVFNSLLFLVVIVLAAINWVPPLLPLAYIIQPIEVLWGTLHPAIAVAPKKIGIRQLMISILFTLVFIVTWIF